jgi:multiple sugar transport system ATP-binding protein
VSFLRLEALEKTFPDGTQAVKGVDLAIDEGEFVVLLGPSGCGKTTTLRMIAGLELPTGGRIHLAGREVTRLRPSKRDVGFVFQFYALYPHLSAAENIEFPLVCAGVRRTERRATVERVVQRLGLEPLLALRPSELSGGDQQRVALARAMVRRPSVHLMDEPLGTLDADRRMEMCEFLRAEQLALEVTTVYVTHDQEEAMRLADRIVVMREGSILQAGSPAEVYDRPSSRFVAEFVGSPGMNFIDGQIRLVDGRIVFWPQGMQLPIPMMRVRDPIASGPATLGVRPEFVRPDAAGPLRGRVVASEYLGVARCLHVETPCGPLVLRTAADEPVALGTEFSIGFNIEHTRLFESRTGDRLA